MNTAKSTPSDPMTNMLEEEVRALVRDRRPKTAKPASETCDELLAAGVTSVEDIERLMEELLIARDFLQSEGERVRLVNARYGHMAKSASASVKIIAESLGKWRSLEAVDQAPAMMPRAPTLAPVHDGELQHTRTISSTTASQPNHEGTLEEWSSSMQSRLSSAKLARKPTASNYPPARPMTRLPGVGLAERTSDVGAI